MQDKEVATLVVINPAFSAAAIFAQIADHIVFADGARAIAKVKSDLKNSYND